MKHGSLFSGIGGFDLAAEWMGWDNIFHCEWNEFGQKILKYYWPGAESYTDITKTDFTKYANKIDILTGGFPCQPFSLAGKRKGADDERYLWHEMLRAIREIKPKIVIAENVFGITNIDGGMVFEQVCLDLEAQGYEVQPFILPACAVNAPHRRDRVWFVATNTNSNGFNERNGNDEINASERGINALNDINKNDGQGDASNTTSERLERMRGKERRCFKLHRGCNGIQNWQNFPTQSPICSGDDGLPTELDGITFSKWRQESIKGYGNAVVPQVAYEIFKAIKNI